MSAPKYTPGPWEAEKSTMDTEWNVYAPDPSEWSDPGDQYVVAGGMREADARLIAAAPELLEALKRVLTHHGYLPGGPDFPDAWAAIDKAEGRSADEPRAWRPGVDVDPEDLA